MGTSYHALMSTGSILLRLLLIAALLVNGVGNAYAATRMVEMVHAGAATPLAAATQLDNLQSINHHNGAHDMAQSGCEDAVAVDSAPAPTPPPHEHDGPDCCKGNTCRCLCLHAATAVAMPPVDLSQVLHPRHMIVWRSLGHAAPALPDLIRPPIG
jgi:hypothetical protein